MGKWGAIIGTFIAGPIGTIIGYGLGEAKDIINTLKDKQELNFGDIIYVDRGLYHHYGIFCDRNSIIHFSSIDSDIGSDNEIIETDIETFKRNDKWVYKLIFPTEYGAPTPVLTTGFAPNDNLSRRKYLRFLKNYPTYHLYSPEETVNRAKSKIGYKGYNLFTNNCEHFAIWCKTNISESHQINDFLDSLERIGYNTI